MRRASLQAADEASGHSGEIVAQSPPLDALDVSALAAPNLAQAVPQLSLLQRWQVCTVLSCTVEPAAQQTPVMNGPGNGNPAHASVSDAASLKVGSSQGVRVQAILIVVSQM
jgi:hypothetical protein